MPNSNTYSTTQIPAPRVPFLDPRTGLMSREWYLYFYNLYTLTGGGQNAVSLLDVQVGPSDSLLASTQANIEAAFQALESSAPLDTLNSEQFRIAQEIQGLEQSPLINALEAAVAKLTADVQGLGLAPTYTPQLLDTRYGVFSDTTTQTAAAINTAYAVTFNTTDLTNGVYIGSPTSRVYVDRMGVYNFQFSAQLDQSSSAAHDVWIWADINGTSVANSATKVTLVGNNAAVAAAWNFVLQMNAGDYFRLMWAVSNTSCQISAVAAAAPIPAIPSVILTVTDNIGVDR